MSVTDWYADFQQKRENRIIKQYQESQPNEAWRQHTDVLRAYGGQVKGLTDHLTAGHIKRGLDAYTMDNFQDRELLHKAQGSKYYGSENMGAGVRNLNQGDLAKHLNTALTEDAKDAGTGNLGDFGAKTGSAHTLAQARAVAEKQGAGLFSPLGKDMMGHFIGASSKESLYNAMGLMTADQKRLYSRPGVGNTITRWGIRSAVAFNIYTGLTSDDPLTDITATVASGWGLQAGWRGGKAAANVLFGAKVGHMSRIALGGVGASVGVAAPLLIGEGIKDITKSDSYVKKVLKRSYKQESLVEDRSSRMALTMRQAGLQKLASSHLNDRGMLLGNEAAILKGVSY